MTYKYFHLIFVINKNAETLFQRFYFRKKISVIHVIARYLFQVYIWYNVLKNKLGMVRNHKVCT